MTVNLTPKQVEILLLVFKKNTDGTHLDLDQLLNELSYKPTKQALQFSIRSLIKTISTSPKAVKNAVAVDMSHTLLHQQVNIWRNSTCLSRAVLLD